MATWYAIGSTTAPQHPLMRDREIMPRCEKDGSKGKKTVSCMQYTALTAPVDQPHLASTESRDEAKLAPPIFLCQAIFVSVSQLSTLFSALSPPSPTQLALAHTFSLVTNQVHLFLCLDISQWSLQVQRFCADAVFGGLYVSDTCRRIARITVLFPCAVTIHSSLRGRRHDVQEKATGVSSSLSSASDGWGDVAYRG